MSSQLVIFVTVIPIYFSLTRYDQMGWPNELSTRVQFWEIVEFEPTGFKPWPCQANDLKIDTCRFLARPLALLG